MKDEYSSLIQRFKLAWNSCRSFLGEQGKKVVYLFRTFVKSALINCVKEILELNALERIPNVKVLIRK